MNDSAGYVQVRRGIEEHCETGKLNPAEFGIYMHLIIRADCETGIVWDSSRGISVRYGYDARATHRALVSLDAKGYIRRFRKQGQHCAYPILVNKYMVSRGAMKGASLIVAQSPDWRSPFYEKVIKSDGSGKSATITDVTSDDSATSDITNSSYKKRHGSDAPPYQEIEVRKNKHTHVESSPDSTGESLLFGLAPATPEPITPEAPDAAIAFRVYQHYYRVMSRDPRTFALTPLRQQKLRARVREAAEMAREHGLESDCEVYQAAEAAMKLAIDRCAKSKFHMGDNDRGRKFNELEAHIFRSREQFERWLDG